VRPIYETAQDRQRENEVRQYIVETYKCKYKKTEILSGVDGYLYDADDVPVAVVEIKCRNNTHGKYPTYMISASKWRNARELAENINALFILVVRFTDGIYAVKGDTDYPTAKGGRWDRGDAKDIEECMYIPLDKFKKI
jgi:hypothetical protein